MEIQHKAEVYASTPGIGQRHSDLPESWFYFRHVAQTPYELSAGGVDSLP